MSIDKGQPKYRLLEVVDEVYIPHYLLAEHVTEVPIETEKIVEVPVEKIVEKVVEKIIEKTVEVPVEKIV